MVDSVWVVAIDYFSGYPWKGLSLSLCMIMQIAEAPAYLSKKKICIYRQYLVLNINSETLIELVIYCFEKTFLYYYILYVGLIKILKAQKI